MHDPFLRAGWYGWGIVVVLLIGVVFACTVSGAQEQNPALAPEKGYCMNGMCIVRQDTLLFNDSIRANIAYGAMGGAGEREVIAAAEAAHALEFIRDTPQGLETLIGEHGMRLSGGQRQRLAIARALLKNAPVLILDEATSALDSESERLVQAALETLMHGRTTIVIAHRLSTIERADRIVVLERGSIVETGSHPELLARGGAYARLYRIQYDAQRASAADA